MKDVEPYSNRDLANIQSWEDAAALVGAVPEAADVIGDGFTLLKDKSALIDKPCIFVTWSWSDGDYTDEFITARVIVRYEDGNIGKYIINDGGLGLNQQLKQYTQETGSQKGLFVAKGLTRSDYEREIDGKKKQVSTWYLNLSK